MRRISNEWGYGEPSFEYMWRLYDYELFTTLADDFTGTMVLTFVSVLVVILIITSDVTATLVVAICVLLTDLFLAGLIFYWNLALNPIVIL